MKPYIVYTEDTKDELKKIFDRQKQLKLFNQPEVWAIIGRSLSVVKLVSTLTKKKIEFVVANPSFHIIIQYDKQKFTYKLKCPFIKVNALPDWEINLSDYLKNSKFRLQIGKKFHGIDYVNGTIGGEASKLIKLFYPNLNNVVSLGVLVDKYSKNDIINSAGFLMMFKKNVNKDSLVQVVYNIPRVTNLLRQYPTKSELLDYLITRIDEEILNGNIKYEK